MKFDKVVENTSTTIELKRVASPYVIDYRGLSEEEINELADMWSAKNPSGGNPFQLGYFLQPGRFNKNLIAS